MKRLAFDTWTLREQLLGLIRRWYLGSLAILAGALIGLALAYLLPPRYEARLAFRVAFNADARYLTPDDYKNWQMEELESFALSDPLLDETLGKLRTLDPAWDQTGIDDLHQALAPRWRNAGTWHLTAVVEDPERAAALLGAWSEVVFDRTTEALAHAETFNQLNTELALQNRSLADIRAEAAALDALEMSVREWVESLGSEDALTARQIAQASALDNRLRRVTLDQTGYPDLPEGENAAGFQSWTQDVLTYLTASRGIVEENRQATFTAITELGESWSEEKTASHGLSAYLLVETGDETAIQVAPLRSIGLWMLSGSLAGLFGWLLLHFAKAVRPKKGDE